MPRFSHFTPGTLAFTDASLEPTPTPLEVRSPSPVVVDRA